jgi:transcriptional regulator with XRE-family HTH domain
MPTRNRTGPIPALCTSVRRLRLATKLTQGSLGELLGVSAQTLSNIEVGRRPPRAKYLLLKFRELAQELNMPEDIALFDEALGTRFLSAAFALNGNREPCYPLHEWRLMQVARIAVRYWPELAWAMEQSAGPALAVVDDILSAAKPTAVDAAFYRDLEQRINASAEQSCFNSFVRSKPIDANKVSKKGNIISQ